MKKYFWITPFLKKHPYHIGYYVLTYDKAVEHINKYMPGMIQVDELRDLFRIRGPKLAIPYNMSEFKRENPYYRKKETDTGVVYLHSYLDNVPTPFIVLQSGFCSEKASFIEKGLGVRIVKEIVRFSSMPDFVYVPFTYSDEDLHKLIRKDERINNRLFKFEKILANCKI